MLHIFEMETTPQRQSADARALARRAFAYLFGEAAPPVCRSASGKPYFDGSGYGLSITHTGDGRLRCGAVRHCGCTGGAGCGSAPARPAPTDGALPSSGGTGRVPRCAGPCGGFSAVLDLEGGVWKIYRPRRHRLSQSVALYSGRPCRVSGWVGPLVSNLDGGGADDLRLLRHAADTGAASSLLRREINTRKTAKIRKFLLTRSFVCDRIILPVKKADFLRAFSAPEGPGLDWGR